MTQRFVLVAASLALATACVASEPGDASRSRRTADFWHSAWVAGEEVERYDSLESMAKAADLVLYGTIVSLEPGRIFGQMPDNYVVYLRADMEVAEVFIGTMPGGPWTVEFMVDGEDGEKGVQYLQDQTPLLPTLYFLREKTDSHDGTVYYRLVNSRAALVNESGTVETVGRDEDEYLRALKGSDFDDLLFRVREIARVDP